MTGSARITRHLHRTLGSACVAVLLGLGAAPSATAENAYWQGRRDAIWENGIDPLTGLSNWYGNPVGGMARQPPDGYAIFAQGPLRTNIRITGSTTVAALIVERNNDVYTFAVQGRLDILGAGVFNKDPTVPIFTISGTLSMHNEARFSASRPLNSALIKIRPGGALYMTGISRGGNAEVENTFGRVTFYGFASADRMQITNMHPFSATRGGRIGFAGRSTGGDARFVNLGFGRIIFSATRGPLGNGIITAGDIYNDGVIDIGLNTLVVADNFVMGEATTGLHELYIDVAGNRAGSVHVNGNLAVGYKSQLIVTGTEVQSGRYLLLRYGGTLSGRMRLNPKGFSAYLQYLPNEIWMIVP